MHTPVGPDNPYGFSRRGFAWEKVPDGSPAHLDFGCNDGDFLASLRRKNVARLVGVDADRDAIDRARKAHPDIEWLHRAGAPLPYDDRAFASITLLDVIEHIDDQNAVLDELHRVLADDGILIVTVPGQHVFSFLDAGNLKFRFPRLHRWFYCLRHGRRQYERRYVSNPDGLIGDISARKRWHEHFSRDRLATLLAASGFQIVEFDGAGLFYRPLSWLLRFCGWIGPLRRCLRSLTTLDAQRFASANLFCVARKTAARPPQASAPPETRAPTSQPLLSAPGNPETA